MVKSVQGVWEGLQSIAAGCEQAGRIMGKNVKGQEPVAGVVGWPAEV